MMQAWSDGWLPQLETWTRESWVDINVSSTTVVAAAVATALVAGTSVWWLLAPRELREQKYKTQSTTMLALLSAVLGLVAIAASQGGNTVTSVLSGSISGTSRSTPTTGALAPQFTVPASADQGAPVLANLRDPQAVDAQTVCPGYKIDRDSVETTPTGGFTARLVLAGNSCNVYGNDVAVLTLTVAYQAADRLRVSLAPTYVGPANETWFALPEELVPRPSDDGGSIDSSELLFEYSNDPSFTFKVRRKATGDVIFDTTGSKLVFEDQFLEMKTALPTDYNLYGLGEVIHGLRLNRKLNSESSCPIHRP